MRRYRTDTSAWMQLLLQAVLLAIPARHGAGFAPSPLFPLPGSTISPSTTTTVLAKPDTNKFADGEVGEGRNWIEKSFPVETTDKIDPKKVEDYNLGISGESFQTGPLSKRMFDAITSRTSLTMNDDIRQAFILYAMDFTAKEATRAALSQNGLEMVLQEEEEDQGMWGDVDSVRLYDADTGIAFSTVYDSLEEAATVWEPGQPFDFVARQVPAKIRELSVDELMQALDPDGSIRAEAKARKGHDGQIDEQALTAIFDDYEIESLSQLADDNNLRVEKAPKQATAEDQAFAGLDTRGYSVISRKELLRAAMNQDGTENKQTLMHVMNALVSHGVVLVDVADGGLAPEAAEAMARMWNTTENFFRKLDGTDENPLASIQTAAGAGSPHAKVGFASYSDGSLLFLETRRERATGKLLPEDARDLLGTDGMDALRESFDIVARIGKDVVRIATAASSIEHGAFAGEDMGIDELQQAVEASRGAARLADELIDDGKPMPTTEIENNESPVSMSPHRLCSYAERRKTNDESSTEDSSREVFGAHTDASFVTAVPVAAVSGLEVYDEEEERWYRPELKARAHWEAEQKLHGKDPSASVDKICENGPLIPWHARYVAIMAGEHLQLSTRNEVPATVHRVVATRGRETRLSAPILLRGRPGIRFDADRYLGGSLGNSLIEQCDGKTMEEIYAETQPSSFQ